MTHPPSTNTATLSRAEHADASFDVVELVILPELATGSDPDAVDEQEQASAWELLGEDDPSQVGNGAGTRAAPLPPNHRSAGEPTIETADVRYPLWCAGDPHDAHRLLTQLDEVGYTPHQLLTEVDPDTCRFSAEATWWWQAARLFHPSLLHGRTSRRLLYTKVDLTIGYTDRTRIERVTTAVCDTVLVSSACTDSTQQPALDLDYPARLGDISGTTYLWIDPTSPALTYHGPDAIDWADRAMAALGLHRTTRPAATHWNDHAPHGALISALSATWQHPFEALLAATDSLEQSRRDALPDGGVWYRVDGDAWLIPSTSWWHLYTTATLDTDTYLAAVDAAAAAGLLNPGFVNAARERGFTSLRRPGLHKPPPAPPFPPDDIPF